MRSGATFVTLLSVFAFSLAVVFEAYYDRMLPTWLVVVGFIGLASVSTYIVIRVFASHNDDDSDI